MEILGYVSQNKTIKNQCTQKSVSPGDALILHNIYRNCLIFYET